MIPKTLLFVLVLVAAPAVADECRARAVLVQITRSACAECDKIDARLEPALIAGFTVERHDLDSAAGRAVADSLGVTAAPTLIARSTDGIELGRLTQPLLARLDDGLRVLRGLAYAASCPASADTAPLALVSARRAEQEGRSLEEVRGLYELAVKEDPGNTVGTAGIAALRLAWALGRSEIERREALGQIVTRWPAATELRAEATRLLTLLPPRPRK